MTTQEWKTLSEIAASKAFGHSVHCKNWNDEPFEFKNPIDLKAVKSWIVVDSKPNLRPWKPREVPMLALIRWKGTLPAENYPRSSITSHGQSSIWLGCGSEGIPFEEALRTLEHSTDGGKTWHPCGVVEGGAA